MKTTKRIVSAILCVLMIGSVLPLTSFAAYENTHVNTGNQIEDLIAVAMTQRGYTEGNSTSQQGGTSGGSGNYTKYGAWYGINPGAWCAMFVSWCANQAGIPSTVIPKHASCDIGMQTFQNRGRWQWSSACGGSYTPKRGDIIYFRTNTNQVTDSTHVGIITSCSGSTIYTIEGNASNKCQTKSYSTTSAYILGYGTPNYSDNSGGGSTSSGASGLGTYQVTVSSSLNMRSGPGTSYGVVQKLYNGNLIEITQISNGWGYGPDNGKSGWISLSYAVLTNSYYYITFDPNGGTITSSTSVFAIKNNTAYSTAIPAIPTVTRPGYVFKDWYCEEYNYILNLGGTFVAGKDVTFKARWTAQPGQYKVTAYYLNMRDGAGSADTTVIDTLEKDDKINITAISGDWGFTTYGGQSGWVSLAYCEYVGPIVEDTPVTPPSTQTYTLTFDPNGGKMPAGYSTTYTFEPEQLFNDVIGGFPVPTHDNSKKIFAGWYWDKAGETSTGYFWGDGWGTQRYAFWDVDHNDYNTYANAKLIAKWTNHECSYESVTTKAATCQSAGVRTYTCTGCGSSYTETIAQLTHKYTSTVTKAPTCSSEGTTLFTCSLCGASYEEVIPSVEGHTYAYSNGKVACTVCTSGYNGWYGGTYYCTNGTCAKGIFKIGADFYYADSNYQAVKGRVVLVSESEKNGLLSGGDSYYEFDSNGKLVTTGFVTGGGNTYYYENTAKVTGLKQIDSDYYYFNNDGTMVKNQYVTIGSGLGLEPGDYYFRADGKMLAKDDGSTREVRHESDGKYRLYINDVLQTNGLFYVNGDYYYALNDGTLATDRTLYTYYSNELFTPGYYKFGVDAKMEKGTWYNYFDGKTNRIYATEADGTRVEGLVYSNGNYYFFHKNSGELVTSETHETIFISADNNNGIPVKSGVYTLDAAGVIQNPILTTSATAAATADGVETGSVVYTVPVESNGAISADTAATVIIAALPTAAEEDDE